jgi:hypothetical protein
VPSLLAGRKNNPTDGDRSPATILVKKTISPTMSELWIMASHRPGDTEPPALALLALG